MKTGILLINTGTPDAPEVGAIQRYLGEFLMDPYIRPLPKVLWKPILSLFILPNRPKHTVSSYEEIWTAEGSPFMLTSASQRDKLQAVLEQRGFCGGEFQLELAMRYGNPSVEAALDRLRDGGCERVVAFPLYPQQVKVCAGTCLKKVRDCLAQLARCGWQPELVEIPYYYDLPAYVHALAASVHECWSAVGGENILGEDGAGNVGAGRGDVDCGDDSGVKAQAPAVSAGGHGSRAKLLVSFHSTLMSDINAGDPYKEQAEATAADLAARLGLGSDDYAVAYQSRFDNRKWLQPSVRETLDAWACEGVRDVCVLCPGFSVDCLESLIEIAQHARDAFLEAAGAGANFTYVPALNDCDAAIECFADAIARACL